MTYDKSDIEQFHKSKCAYMKSASGDISWVEGADTIQISPTLKVSNL